MDITFALRRARKSIAGISLLALLTSLVSFSGTALAFTDTDGHWAEDYINDLYEQDVVDGVNNGDTFNPDGTLNRAEYTKMAVNAFLGVDAVTNEHNDGSFTDVPEGAWYEDYVYTAKYFGIVGGYTDANGDPTGKFGPSDMVNRAAMVKIVVEAASLTGGNPGSDTFSDVVEDSWYDDYVGTAYHWSVVDGKTQTTFAPAETGTRAEAAKVIVNGQNPVQRPPEGTETGEATLKVELNSDSPEGMTIPSGATSVVVGTWDFTSMNDNATVTGITFKQSGVSDLPSDHKVYLYEGTDRLTSNRTVNSSSNEVSFTNLNLDLSEGETREFSLRLDVGTVDAVKKVMFEIDSEEDVTSNALDVSGSFPVSAATHDLFTDAAGTVTIAKNGTITNPRVGEDDVTVGKFKLTTSGNDGNLSEIGVYVAGTISTSEVQNLELWASGGVEPIATVDGVDDRDVARFVLEDLYPLEDGSTTTFTVVADMSTGRTDDNLKLYLDETADLLVLDDQYDVGMSVTRTTYDGDSCTSGSGDCSFSTLEGGDITMTSSGPLSGDIAIDGDDVPLINLSVVTTSEVTFDSFLISLLGSESADTTEGLMNSSTANFTDIKIVDQDSGDQIWGPVDVDVFKTTGGGDTAIGTTAITEAAGDDARAYYAFTDDWTLDAGSEVEWVITTDIANTTTLAGMTLDTSIEIGATYPSLKDANNKVLTNSDVLVPPNDLTGDQQTLAVPGLTFGGPVDVNSDTFVEGSPDVTFVCFSVRAGSTSDIELNDLTLTTSYDENNDGTYGIAGSDDSINANTVVGSLELVDAEGELIASAENVTSGGLVPFTNINYLLEAGVTEKICATGDISSNGYNGSEVDKIAFGINDADDVVASQDGSTLAASQISGLTNPINVSASSPDVVMTVSDGGTLTLNVLDSTRKEDILVAGTTGVEISSFELTSTDEDFTVDRLALVNRDASTPGDYDDNTTAVYLTYTDSDGAEAVAESFFTDGNAVFENLDIFVEKDEDATVVVSVDLQTVNGGADSGDYVDINLAMNNFRAVASSTYLSSAMDDADADGEMSDSKLVINGFEDADFVNTVVYTNDAADLVGTTTLGASSSFSIDNNGADQADLPAGTFLCMTDAGGDTACDSSTDDIYVVTAWVDGSSEDTVTATQVSDSGDGTYDAADEVLYAIPGEQYLTGANRMHVHETKPTLARNVDSPNSDQTEESDDTMFIFDVTASTTEDVQIRTASELTTCLAGNSTVTVENAATTTAAEQVDGSGCNVDAVAAADDFVAYSAPGLEDYDYASFWIRWVDSQAADNASLIPTEIQIGCNTDNTGATEHTTTVAASNLLASPSTMLEGTWFHVYDVAMPAACTTTDEFFNVVFPGANDAGPDHADDDVFIDRVVLYNDKVTIDLASDTDFDIDADGDSAHEDEVPVLAYLREDGVTAATGYITVGSNVADMAESNDTASAIVHFYPISGTNSQITVSEGETAEFSLATNSATLIDADSGSDDNILISMDLGSSADGTVTAGDFWWYDTNVAVRWAGHITPVAKVSGNTLTY